MFVIIPALLFAIWGYTHIEGGGGKHLVNALGFASFGALVGLYLGFTFMLATAWADDGKGGTPGLVWRYPLVIVGLLLLFALELFVADSSSTGISNSATNIPGGFCALLALAAVFVAEYSGVCVALHLDDRHCQKAEANTAGVFDALARHQVRGLHFGTNRPGSNMINC